MMFPAPRIATAVTLAFAMSTLGTPTAAADDPPPPPPPPLHHVQYTVFTESPFHAQIYYRDTDPANFADYSHDPFVFSPKVEADVGPNQMWTLDVMLVNPDYWAMVTVTGVESARPPNFHCVIGVDGKVVATNEGPKGALCSIRNW